MRTRVKICGITRPEDGLQAARLGADAIGLVFYEPSPRAVTTQQARKIVRALPAFVTVVALFVDADSGTIESVLQQVDIDLVQFHGQETPAQCEAVRHRYLKAVSMREGVDLHAVCRDYASATAILVDSYRPGVPGGSGEVFDWQRIPADLDKPVILAGGLQPDNVADAIRTVRPWAVDVSSGVEQHKGIKDEGKIEAFMRGVASV